MTHSFRGTVVGVVLFAALFAQVSFADTSAKGNPESGVLLASKKLVRGVVNYHTGVGEIVRQPIVCVMDEGWAALPAGIVNGFFMSFVRTGVGAFETVTFFVPFDDDSIGYGSLLDPDYVWQKADSKSR